MISWRVARAVTLAMSSQLIANVQTGNVCHVVAVICNPSFEFVASSGAFLLKMEPRSPVPVGYDVTVGERRR